MLSTGTSDFADNELPLALFGGPLVRSLAISAKSMKNLSNVIAVVKPEIPHRGRVRMSRADRDWQIIRPWEKPPFIKLGWVYMCMSVASPSKTGSLIY